MKKPELLAPAGNFEKLKTAIHYGADSVYLGTSQFSLRGKAGNFDDDELKKAVTYAHDHSVKVYVTVNIFPHNRDLNDIKNHIALLCDVKPDGVLVSDPGICMLLKERAPELPLHISTQANITNSMSAQFWERLGASRLVLSRELSIAEIREIRDKTTLELEVFVHGSICISYSGRCYISSLLAARSANVGECTNACRWSYALMEENRKGDYFPVFEDERGTYILSSKDLCMIQHLPKLVQAGIDSFKIEGRMKGINYVAGVVKTYREAIDALVAHGEYRVKKRWLRELSMFSSRGYTSGMFFGRQPDRDYNFDGESYRMTHDLVGVIYETDGNTAKVGLRNRLDCGDTVEYLTPGYEEREFIVSSIKNEKGEQIGTARNQDIIFIPVPSKVRTNDLLRRRKNKISVPGQTEEHSSF